MRFLRLHVVPYLLYHYLRFYVQMWNKVELEIYLWLRTRYGHYLGVTEAIKGLLLRMDSVLS